MCEVMHNFAGAREQTDAAPCRVCMRGTLLPDDDASAASVAAAVILMSALCMCCVIMAHIMPLSRPLLALGACLCLPQMSRLCRRRIFSVTVNNAMQRCESPRTPRSHSLFARVWLCALFPPSAFFFLFIFHCFYFVV